MKSSSVMGRSAATKTRRYALGVGFRVMLLPGERASRTAGMCVCTSTERERTVLGEVSLWNERGER
jgi:hypothetical protein